MNGGGRDVASFVGNAAVAVSTTCIAFLASFGAVVAFAVKGGASAVVVVVVIV